MELTKKYKMSLAHLNKVRKENKLYTYAVVALFLVGSVFGVLTLRMQAAFNEQINYQGRLTDNSGNPVVDANYTMLFELCTTTTGAGAGLDLTAGCTGANSATYWSETQTVGTKKGLFSVLLGSITPLTTLSFDQTLYLRVTVNAAKLLPVKKLAAIPAAFEAKQLGGKTWAIPGAVGSTTPNTGAFTEVTTTSAATTGTAINSTANSLTSGKGFSITSTNAAVTGNLLYVNSNSTAAVANGLVRFQFTGAHTNNGVQIDDATVTGTAMRINADSATSGTGLYVSANGLTSGFGLIVAGTGLTGTGNLLYVTSASTAAATNGLARFNFVGAHTGNGLQINDATATGTAMEIYADGLTSGTGLALSSVSTAGIGGGNSKMLVISKAGANANANHTAYGLYTTITNTNATSGVNVAAYLSASGATNMNNAIIVPPGGGKVGIGTEVPYYPLNVMNDSQMAGFSTGIAFSPNDGTSAPNNMLFIGRPNSSDAYYAKISSGRDGGSNINSYLSFYTEAKSVTGNTDTSTEKMRILSNGNVGIGTSSPDNKLTISGVGGGGGINLYYTNAVQYPNIWGRIAHMGGSGDPNGLTLSSSGDNSSPSAGLISFRTGLNGTVATRMVITETGDVGIGTTGPGGKLAVVAGVGQTGIAVSGNNTNGIDFNASYTSPTDGTTKKGINLALNTGGVTANTSTAFHGMYSELDNCMSGIYCAGITTLVGSSGTGTTGGATIGVNAEVTGGNGASTLYASAGRFFLNNPHTVAPSYDNYNTIQNAFYAKVVDYNNAYSNGTNVGSPGDGGSDPVDRVINAWSGQFVDGIGMYVLNTKNLPSANGLTINIAQSGSTSSDYLISAVSNSTSKFFVRADGKVGIGTSSISGTETLKVVGDINTTTGYQANGVSGISGTKNVGSCTITFTGGIATNTTCP